MIVQRNQIYQNEADDGDWVRWKNQSETANLRFPEAVMGAALFDLNQDLLPDIFLTNLLEGTSPKESLHRNLGNFVFEDITDDFGVNGLIHSEETSLYRTSSWAALNLDYDNDGDDDLYTVYGHHQDGEEIWRNCEVFISTCPDQPNALFENLNNERFQERAGSAVEDQGMGRGAAAGDINKTGAWIW